MDLPYLLRKIVNKISKTEQFSIFLSLTLRQMINPARPDMKIDYQILMLKINRHIAVTIAAVSAPSIFISALNLSLDTNQKIKYVTVEAINDIKQSLQIVVYFIIGSIEHRNIIQQQEIFYIYFLTRKEGIIEVAIKIQSIKMS
ncbi:hypothetical protein SS50377_22154 [Spironucleus salmonicida]|uniref:Transmembrane protein n=1 Tax=Spironucleus salmonicida TaxID=348837 RepID=A0A9P8S142_9EUKA|nr:hypothetical protein SS50377_22154 [Spironucleus salmonicida]